MKRVVEKMLSRKKELPFKPVESKITINLGPETFAHSDAFSKMMDRAHRLAMRRNDTFGAGRERE